jgi:glycosyltransferase involved in cell wall biosynthesis
MGIPLVSIVIPTFNQGSYLPTCIDHCLFQTYPNLEIIIIDGGSTDGTKEYLKKLPTLIKTKSYHPVIKLDGDGNIIRQEKHTYPMNRNLTIIPFYEDIGATRTYNEGLKRVGGKYCTYIVGDDIPYPHMIEDMVFVLESNGSDFVYSDMNVVDDCGCIIRQMRLPYYSFSEFFAKWYHLGVSHLYRSEWHEKVGLMDESYKSANDYDHYLRFAMAGAKFFHLPKVLYAIRYHGDNRKTGQHTNSMYDNLLEESKKCAWRARQWMSEHGKIEYSKRESI